MSNAVVKKTLYSLMCIVSLMLFTQLSWGGSQLEGVDFQLKKPLLVINEAKGFLACAYIDVETCNKLNEACAIVSGVNNYDDMKKAKIVKVSNAAQALGVNIGDTGASALLKFGS
ncbi:MAG: DUF1805 domain-containing protein [Cellvibrionaceae bacterium]|nr:DUF1805 domain-containing protein [Cellvibrionaceae bacterium]